MNLLFGFEKMGDGSFKHVLNLLVCAHYGTHQGNMFDLVIV